jgi:transcriptional repressor NrdR
MRCPYCGSSDTQVKDSRPAEDSSCIRRRRVCPTCGGRFTTFERVQLREIVVLKKSGKRAPFDRDKLTRSVEIALRKRPVEPERVEQMISGIVRQLESLGESEVESQRIGELIIEGLRTLDAVAYVRSPPSIVISARRATSTRSSTNSKAAPNLPATATTR